MRPSVRPQRARRGEGGGRLARRGEARRKVVVFVASTPDFTGQPKVANGASGCSARSSARPASTPGPRSACRSSRWTCPSRSRSSSRSRRAAPAPSRGPRRPGQVVRRGVRPRPAEPRDAATVVLLRAGAHLVEGTGDLSPPPPDLDGLRRRHVRVPRGGVDPRDYADELVERGLWAGPSPAEWARGWASTSRRRAPGPAPRCGRPSRSRGSRPPGRAPTRSSPTRRVTTGRPTGSPSRRASCR